MKHVIVHQVAMEAWNFHKLRQGPCIMVLKGAYDVLRFMKLTGRVSVPASMLLFTAATQQRCISDKGCTRSAWLTRPHNSQGASPYRFMSWAEPAERKVLPSEGSLVEANLGQYVATVSSGQAKRKNAGDKLH